MYKNDRYFHVVGYDKPQTHAVAHFVKSSLGEKGFVGLILSHVMSLCQRRPERKTNIDGKLAPASLHIPTTTKKQPNLCYLLE